MHSSLHSNLASVISSLITGEKKRKERDASGGVKDACLNIYVPSRNFLRVLASVDLASSILVTRKGQSECDVMGERTKTFVC